MKSIHFWIIFILAIFAFETAFAAETVSQKIGIETDISNTSAVIDRLIRKTVLLNASGMTNVYILSSEKDELKSLGISALNGKVQIRTVIEGDVYRIRLSAQAEKGWEMFDDSLTIERKSLIDGIDTLSDRIIRIIEQKFPPKPKQEILTIEIEKKGISEFETAEPTWRLTLAPYYQNLRFYLDLETKTSSNGTKNMATETNLGFVGLSAMAEFQYFNWFVRASLKFAGVFDYFSARLMGGIGIFESVVVLGAGVDYTGGGLNYTHTYTSSEGTNLLFSAAISRFDYNMMQIFMYTRFNIDKNYYIDMSVGGALGNSMYAINLYFPGTACQLTNNNEGITPTFNVSFNGRINDQWKIKLFYEYQEIGFRKNWQAAATPNLHFNPTQFPNSYIRESKLNFLNLGVGVEYEF